MVLIRSSVLLLIVSLMTVASPGIVRAGPDRHGTVTVFSGQVTALSGPVANPTGLTLQDRIRSVDIRIAPETMFRARSAEAEVEGLVVGDYAVIGARKGKGSWIANRISFDVRPMVAGTLVTGTIVKLSSNGKQLQLRLDTGQMQPVTIGPRTKYRIDGQPTDTPPELAKGDVVQVLMRSAPRGWTAMEINLLPSSLSPS